MDYGLQTTDYGLRAMGYSMFCAFLMLFMTLCRAYGEDVVWLKYEAVEKTRGMDLPIKGLRAEEYACYAALQYGSKASEVVYLVFDCVKKLSPHNYVYVYIPEHARYGKPVRLKGRKRAGVYVFPSVSFKSRYGELDMLTDIDIKARSLWDALDIDVDIEVSCVLRDLKKARKSKFLLKGSLAVTMNDAVYIDVVPLLQPPVLKGRWDHRSDPPHVRGKISVGKLGLIPESGISDKARLNIYEKDSKKLKMTRSFKVNPRGAYTEFTFYPWKRLKERREYDMKLMMDLSPFFGQLSAQDRMVLR
jgi:hypothetical protein